METAAAGLGQALDNASFGDPHFAVYANVNGEAVTQASRAKQLLLEQLSKPVRWTDEIRALAARFPDALFVEMGPGNVLVGLVKVGFQGLTRPGRQVRPHLNNHTAPARSQTPSSGIFA
jgi:[acyl-carrier-protein] S-malonyltransferase